MASYRRSKNNKAAVYDSRNHMSKSGTNLNAPALHPRTSASSPVIRTASDTTSTPVGAAPSNSTGTGNSSPTNTIASLTSPNETFVASQPGQFAVPDSLPAEDTVIGVLKDNMGTITSTMVETPGGIKYTVGGAPITSVQNMGNGEWQTPAGSMGGGTIPGAEGIIDRPNAGDVIAPDFSGGGYAFDVTQHAWYPTANGQNSGYGYQNGVGYVYADNGQSGPVVNGSLGTPAASPVSGASTTSSPSNSTGTGNSSPTNTIASLTSPNETFVASQPGQFAVPDSLPAEDTVIGVLKDNMGTITSTMVETPGGIKYTVGGAPITSVQNMGNGEWQTPAGSMGGGTIPGAEGIIDRPNAGDVIAPDSGNGMSFDVTRRAWVNDGTFTTKYVPGTGYVADNISAQTPAPSQTPASVPAPSPASTTSQVTNTAGGSAPNSTGNNNSQFAPVPNIGTPTGVTKNESGTIVSTQFQTPGGIQYTLAGAPVSAPTQLPNKQWEEPVQASGMVADTAKAGDVIAPGGAGMDFDVTTRTWVPSANVNTTYAPGTGYVASGGSTSSSASPFPSGSSYPTSSNSSAGIAQSNSSFGGAVPQSNILSGGNNSATSGSGVATNPLFSAQMEQGRNYGK